MLNASEISGNGTVDIPLACWLSLRPWRTALILLLLVFGIEVGIMLYLPPGLEQRIGLVCTAALDALLLSALLIPGLWRLIVNPLSQVAECRRLLFEWALSTEERKARQISRDLHDGIGQLAASIDVGLASLEKEHLSSVTSDQIQQLRSVAKRLQTDIRSVARGLRPHVLDDMGLSAAIQNYVSETASQTCEVNCHHRDIDNVRMPEPIETALFRIVQEAVTNAIRHGHPRHVEIEIGLIEGVVDMTIQDDGQGFSLEEKLACRTGVERPFGLVSMIERAHLLGGTAKVWSQPGFGTRINVRIPLALGNR